MAEQDARQVLVEILGEVLDASGAAKTFPGTPEEMAERVVGALDEYLDERAQDYAHRRHSHASLSRIG